MDEYEAYQYLLEMVNRKITYSLDLIYSLKEHIKALKSLEEPDWNNNIKWYNEKIKNEKLQLKDLKRIKRFLIEEKRTIKSIENFVVNFFKKLVK